MGSRLPLLPELPYRPREIKKPSADGFFISSQISGLHTNLRQELIQSADVTRRVTQFRTFGDAGLVVH